MLKFDDLKELRARTHLGMTECKKALEVCDGNIERALEYLQKQGLKKVDDLLIPLEGVAYANIGQKNGLAFGHIIELNCQTDFGARSELFQNTLGFLTCSLDINEIIKQEAVNTLSKQLGEKILLRRDEILELTNEREFITAYNHLNGKIAVLLQVSIFPGREKESKVLDLLDNITMQIAATKPLSVDRGSLPENLVQKKIAFYEEEVKFKPADIRRKILDGKMEKWYSDIVLLEQEAIFIGYEGPKGQTIQKEIDKLGLNGLLNIKKFVRYELGEVM